MTLDKQAKYNLRLAAIERFCFRRMLRISLVDRVTNLEVRQMGKKEEIVKIIKKKARK